MPNFSFPYKWRDINDANVDILLDALIRKDYNKAENLINNGMRLEDIDEGTFHRALYEFLADYEMMNFLVGHGFNFIHFRYANCCDEKSRIWGIVARAYSLNRIDIVELLFSVGFSPLRGGENFWIGNENEPRVFWKYVLLERCDKEIIDLMLSYGESPDYIGVYVDYPDYDQRANNYLKSKPKINWKGYALCSKWEDEIPEPSKPRIGFFTSKMKREILEEEYKKAYDEYLEKVRVRNDYINSITGEEWKLIEEYKEVSRLTSQYMSQMRR